MDAIEIVNKAATVKYFCSFIPFFSSKFFNSSSCSNLCTNLHNKTIQMNKSRLKLLRLLFQSPQHSKGSPLFKNLALSLKYQSQLGKHEDYQYNIECRRISSLGRPIDIFHIYFSQKILSYTYNKPRNFLFL
jgi:hypothetical protein